MRDIFFNNLRLRDRVGLAAVALAAAVFLILRFEEFPVGAGMDDAYYIELARSLAEGRGPVIHLNDTQPPLRPGIFPIGFPLLLAPLAALGTASVDIFKLVPLLALVGLVFICLRFSCRTSAGRALALAALFCLNPWTIGFAVRVFSDLPFALMSLAAVLLFLELAEVTRPERSRFTLLVIVTAASVMIRSIGLALPVAMVLYWMWGRRWRRALILALGVALALLPHAAVSRGTGGGLITPAYLQQVFFGHETLGARLALMGANLVGYLRELSVVMLPVFGNPLQNLAAQNGLGAVYGPGQLVAGIFLAWILVRGLTTAGGADRGRARFLLIYLAVYSLVLLNFSGYPSGVQPRLLLPILPLLYLSLLEFLHRLNGPGHRPVFWPTVFLLLSLSILHNGFRAARPMRDTPDASQVVLADPGLGTDWIRANTQPGDLVMVRRPLRQHIHFQRPVVGFGAVGGFELDRRINRYGVNYIFLGPGQPDAATANLSAVLQADPSRFEPVHSDPDIGIMIFRVAKVP